MKRHIRSTPRWRMVARLAALSCAGIAISTLAKPYSYIALHNQSAVAVYDHATSAWLGTIAVGAGPLGISPDPAQRYAYISNYRDGNVSIVRIASRTPLGTVNVGQSPMGIALTQTPPRAFVANYADNTVSVIDTATNTVLSTINVGTGPTSVVASTSGDRIFVANTVSNSVSVISVASNTVIQTVPVVSADNPNARPYALEFVNGPSGSRLLVTNNNAASVSIFDGNSYAPLAEVKVGAQPTALAAASANKVFVMNGFDATMHTIDPFTNAVTAGPLAALAGANSLAVSFDGSVGSIAAAPASFATLTPASNTIGAPIAVTGAPLSTLTLGKFVMNPAFECALDLNNNNAFDDTDHAVIARYIAGIRGAELVSGVSGVDATLTHSLLSGLSLDADNDGAALLTTDALLLNRASKGLIGPNLIANARNTVALGAFTTGTQVLNWIVTTHGANCLP